jgi:eukaryotic translation initiation factor 2C
MQAVHVVKAQPQYCSNLCMKINAKLGGSTSRVGVAKPLIKDFGPSKFFEKYTKTMVIGADVSHASPGSPQASMAALTMSMDKHASRYAAAVQTNGHR